jgi:hypothetical protein
VFHLLPLAAMSLAPISSPTRMKPTDPISTHSGPANDCTTHPQGFHNDLEGEGSDSDSDSGDEDLQDAKNECPLADFEAFARR